MYKDNRVGVLLFFCPLVRKEIPVCRLNLNIFDTLRTDTRGCGFDEMEDTIGSK